MFLAIEIEAGGALYRQDQISRIVPDLVHLRRNLPHLHEVGGVRLELLLQAGRIGRCSLQPRPIFIWVKDDRHAVMKRCHKAI